MKKVLITVAATLFVLFFMAQMGFLEIFGIHGITGLFTDEDSNSSAQQTAGFAAYTDSDTGVQYLVKTEGDYFYIYRDGEWQKLFLAGVNIGATEPSLFPGDLTISYETYYRWFKYIGEMNCNCVRVYTLMRPQFYMALNDYNLQAENPLLLFQGVWMNEEDIDRITDVYAENEKILVDFKNDALKLIDVIHGNAVVDETPGEASGTYVTDVSRWFGGWIIGIEWDPNLVVKTNSQHPEKNKWDGSYLYTQAASPFEAFLCEVGDEMITYETETYNFQTPLAFTNWITTDPLNHENEPHPDEDKVSVNVEDVRWRINYKPGMFASYHIYPYYPDSLNYQQDYLANRDVNGNVDTYSAYLADIKMAHTMPILVAEFGVPTSRGMGHESVMGYNQGRIDENDQGRIISNMINSIYDESYAGCLIFTWQDEWFKRTWNNVMFDIADRRPFWSNIQTTEQCFGLMAFDPGEIDCTCYIDGDVADWKSETPVVDNESGKLYVKSDERYVYLMVETPQDFDFANDKIYIPINTIDDQGNTSATAHNLSFDTGADFLIMINGEENSHIYVDSYYDAFYYHFIESKILMDYPLNENAKVKNTGTFNEMLMCYGYNLTVPGPNTVVKDKAFETGYLQYGNGNPSKENYASLSDYCYKDGHIEIRIPWQLLNVMDPSSKQQMDDFWYTQVFSAKSFEFMNFGLGAVKNNAALSIDITGQFYFEEWNMPKWHERLKPAYYELQAFLEGLTQAVSNE